MANLIVTNSNDSGAGSLRDAIAQANATAAADTITFSGGLAGATIRLASQLVVTTGAIDIDGDLDNDGDADITLSGDSNNNGIADAGDTSLLRVAAGADVGLDGLVLADGFGVGADGTYGSMNGANAAGAIENLGVLAIANSVFRDNSAKGGAGYGFFFSYTNGGNGGAAAGAILNAGSLTVTNTQFANNRADGGDGGVGSNGSDDFGGPTLDGDDGGDGGFAAAAILNLASGELVLTNVVLRDGTAEGGSGGAGGDGNSYSFGGFGDGGDGGDGGAASAGIINAGTISGDMDAYPGSSLGGPGGAGGEGADPDGYSSDGANGTPGATDDALINSGTAAVDITIFGTQSADTFAGTAAVDRYNGLGGDDDISGLAADDILAGGAGNDAIDGGTGADTISGGLGNDKFAVDSAGDEVIEAFNQGYDTVNTTLSSYKLSANVERVNFTGVGNFVGTGNALANRFQAGAGNDRFVDVLSGADIFSGGGGTDTVDYRTSAIAVVLNFITGVHGGGALGDSFSGIEKFLGSLTGDDRMSAGGVGRVIYAGYGGDDRLNGGVKNDQLLGGDGNDILKGNADGDALDGGGGDDTMTGGTGADDFIYTEAAFGQDTITDYEDGLDSFRMFSAVADDIADFTITGNGTASVILSLIANPANTITLNGASPITITNGDFEFY